VSTYIREKRATLIVIPSVRFTKLIIHHLQRKHRFHPRLDSLLHLSNEEPVLGFLKEPESGKYQPLPEVPGKGKAKVSKEQVAHDLLSLQKHKKTSPANQYLFQRRVSKPTASSFHDVGSNPDETSEGQVGPDPGNAEARVQSTLNPMVHAGSDREHMDTNVANVSPQPSTEQLYEGFTATIYPNVQENLKLAVQEPVLLEEPASSSGTLSSLQHLSRDFTFGD
nr:hypothetical protein [Tanacetum cinerariifolium]